MTKKRFGFGIFVLAILFGITFIGCDDDPWDGVEIPEMYHGTWSSSKDPSKIQIIEIKVKTIKVSITENDKTEENTYEVLSVALLQDGWHNIALFVPPYEPIKTRFNKFKISEEDTLLIDKYSDNEYAIGHLPIGEYEWTD